MLNIAIIVNSLDPVSGGEITYTKSLISKLIKHKDHNLRLHYFSNYKNEFLKTNNLNINFKSLKYNLFRKIYDLIKMNLLKLIKYNKKYNLYLDSFFKEKKIDIIYFISPNHYSTKIYNTKFVTTVWDLCHREHSEFPEVGRKDIYRQRELFLKNSLNRSSIIITDNNLTKNNITKYYNVDNKRIKIIPYYADTNEFDVNEKISNDLHLDEPFIFYPANFWKHKNHKLVLEVIHDLKKDGHYFNLVLTGTNKGYLEEIKKTINQLKLNDRVYFLGHLKKNEINNLYEKAHCLFMPTYFGPSNLPPLEAAKFNCPIVYTYFGEDDYILPENAYWPIKEFNIKTIKNIIVNIDKKKQETIAKITSAKKFNDEMCKCNSIQDLISLIKTIILKSKND